MPIYRFFCKKCRKSFETLLPRFDAEAHCPGCDGTDLRRENTAFSAVTQGKNRCAASGNCPHENGSCACSCGCGGHHHHGRG